MNTFNDHLSQNNAQIQLTRSSFNLLKDKIKHITSESKKLIRARINIFRPQREYYMFYFDFLKVKVGLLFFVEFRK